MGIALQESSNEILSVPRNVKTMESSGAYELD